MTTQPKFQWTHHPQECDLCGECVDTCKSIQLTNLKRIVHDPKTCIQCECCSTICNAITTEFI